MPLYDDRFYFRPLIPLLFALMAGIVAAHTLPGVNRLALAMAIPAGAVMLALLLSNRSARVLPLIFFFALGYLSLAPWQIVPEGPDHLRQYARDTEKSWQITGRIANTPSRVSYRVKFRLSDLKIASPDHPDGGERVRGDLRMTVYGPRQNLRRHDHIRFQSRIRPFHNFNNPGGFDYKSFMAYRNVWASAYASGNRLEVKQSADVDLAVSAFGRTRQAVRGLINTSTDGDRRAILSALVLGSRDAISPALKTAFNRAGVSHVLAISGLHIGIVAAFAFFCFKRLLMLWPAILHRGWTRKIAALLAVLPVFIYGLLAGFSPSTQRATIMVSVFLMSFLIERDHDLPNTLAAAALIILIIYPPALFAISFQLSFMAVLSIIIGLSSTRHWQNRFFQGYGLMAPVLSFMMVSLFAIIGTTPLIMHYFNQAAFLGLLTNLLIIPIIGFFVVPVALFSVLAVFPLYPPLADLGLKAAGLGIDLALAIIYPVGQWPFSAMKTITPSILELVCFYSLFYGLLILMARHNKTPSQARPRLKRPAAFIITAAFIVISADIIFWCHDRFWKNEFTATIVDVGQGSAALLELPKGHRMLVDGGGFTSNAVFDVGKNILAPLLWDRKIGTVDTVVLSHPDADHLNGLIYILNHFHVKEVISTHQPSDSDEYAAFEQAIRKNRIKHLPFDQIPRRFHINGVIFEILHPLPENAGIRGSGNTNDHSIVLKASYKGKALLLPGDIMKGAEEAILNQTGKALQAEVLIAPHHGSKTSSTERFLDAVNPRAVIISAGIQNRFDLPASSVIQRYREIGCRILRTNQNGAIEITLDGSRVTLQPFLGEPLVLRVGY